MALGVWGEHASYQPFNSHEWPRQNFSSQYQYNIKQTKDESKEKYKLGNYQLVLQANMIRIVYHAAGRIINEI